MTGGSGEARDAYYRARVFAGLVLVLTPPVALFIDKPMDPISLGLFLASGLAFLAVEAGAAFLGRR